MVGFIERRDNRFESRWRTAIVNLQTQADQLREAANRLSLYATLDGQQLEPRQLRDVVDIHATKYREYTVAAASLDALLWDYNVDRPA